MGLALNHLHKCRSKLQGFEPLQSGTIYIKIASESSVVAS